MFLIHPSFIVLLSRVTVGSLEHISPILFALIFGVLYIRYANRNLNKKQQKLAFHFLGVFVSLIVLVFHLYNICFGNYNITTDLPLYICSLMALLIPVFTYYRKFWMFEILLFWVIAGTFQGVVTPDIPLGFPSFDYFRFWLVHLGLTVIICYAIFVLKMKPKIASVFKSFFALQFYVFLMIFINHSLKANYFYLIEKPQSASLLDYFGEWPYYIIVVQIIIIPYFFLIYLPFYLIERKRNNENGLFSK